MTSHSQAHMPSPAAKPAIAFFVNRGALERDGAVRHDAVCLLNRLAENYKNKGYDVCLVYIPRRSEMPDHREACMKEAAAFHKTAGLSIPLHATGWYLSGRNPMLSRDHWLREHKGHIGPVFHSNADNYHGRSRSIHMRRRMGARLESDATRLINELLLAYSSPARGGKLRHDSSQQAGGSLAQS